MKYSYNMKYIRYIYNILYAIHRNFPHINFPGKPNQESLDLLTKLQ